MEEGAPLDPSSGGTPTAMVAVPMLNSALGQRLSIFGGTGVGTKMEASIHLRAKPEKQHTQPQQSQREREREKVNADTHAPRGGTADGGEPQTLFGRLQRVVLPVKKGL